MYVGPIWIEQILMQSKSRIAVLHIQPFHHQHNLMIPHKFPMVPVSVLTAAFQRVSSIQLISESQGNTDPWRSKVHHIFLLPSILFFFIPLKFSRLNGNLDSSLKFVIQETTSGSNSHKHWRLCLLHFPPNEPASCESPHVSCAKTIARKVRN